MKGRSEEVKEKGRRRGEVGERRRREGERKQKREAGRKGEGGGG